MISSKNIISKNYESKCSELWSNSAQSISVWLSHHNITHSSMSEPRSAALLSMAPLCCCHLRNNRNAHRAQPSLLLCLPPQSKADCWRTGWWVRRRRQKVKDIQWVKEKEENKRGGRYKQYDRWKIKTQRRHEIQSRGQICRGANSGDCVRWE